MLIYLNDVGINIRLWIVLMVNKVLKILIDFGFEM